MYCDLGGSVETYGTRDNFLHVDTFFLTLLKEGEEESGSLYKFTDSDFLERAYVISYIYSQSGFYEEFESVLAFYEVNEIYFTNQFMSGSQACADELNKLNLCSWGYQEKDDYQWIALKSLYNFLQESKSCEGVFNNILNKEVVLNFRSHFIEMLRSEESLETLSTILQDSTSFTFVDDTYLYSGFIGNRKAILSNKKGISSPLGTTAIASYNNLSCCVE